MSDATSDWEPACKPGHCAAGFEASLGDWVSCDKQGFAPVKANRLGLLKSKQGPPEQFTADFSSTLTITQSTARSGLSCNNQSHPIGSVVISNQRAQHVPVELRATNQRVGKHCDRSNLTFASSGHAGLEAVGNGS